MERFSRRQGFRLMLGATQAVLLGAAGCPFVGYAATVTGIPGLVAYWRFSSAGEILDETGSNRDGTYDGTVSLVDGLPTVSDAATHLPGTVVGTIPHDASLELAAFTLSFWVQVNNLPASRTAILSKDQSGAFNGDFSLTLDDETGGFSCQFQSIEEPVQVAISTTIATDTAYHLVITAGPAGFELWIDGKHIGTNTDFTGGWTDNTQPIQIASVPWAAGVIVDMNIDEMALYSRVLTDDEIIALSQRTGAPTVGPRTAIVNELATVIVDVAAGAQYVGRKEDLILAITTDGSFGDATIDGNNDVSFEADSVEATEADTVQYTIEDVNGVSAEGSIDITVSNLGAGDGGGGTLVFTWQPLASWIDGVALSSRNASVVRQLARWTDEDASVGSTLVPIGVQAGSPAGYCYNRAPTDEPSIEVYSADGAVAVMDIGLKLWEFYAGEARHVRFVMELKTCKTSDPTDYKSDGLGPTGGSYPNWMDCHNGAIKYFLGLWGGDLRQGGGDFNWWNEHSSGLVPGTYANMPLKYISHRIQASGGSGSPSIYAYCFDRPKQFAGTQDDYGPPSKIGDTGVTGVWVKWEVECKLADPASVHSSCRATDPSTTPVRTGNGFAKHYLTKDMDGELGTPGVRQEVASATHRNIGATGITWSAIADDAGSDPDGLHISQNWSGPWLNLFYGGANSPSVANVWAWIRKIEVYRHD